MPNKTNHQAYMAFVSKLTDLVSDYSAEDLRSFLASARRGFPGVVPVVEAYIEMLNATSGSQSARSKVGEPYGERTSLTAGHTPENQENLSDLLCSKTLFPTNKDLINFAIQVLPDMPKRRYDKMSRCEIVEKICHYLDKLNSRKRMRLERAMRKAIEIMSAEEEREVDSFFSQWERIIKGIDL